MPVSVKEKLYWILTYLNGRKQIVLFVLFVMMSGLLFAQTSVTITSPSTKNTFTACLSPVPITFSADVLNIGNKKITNYTWNLGNAIGDVNVTSNTIGTQQGLYTASGTYTIKLIVYFDDNTSVTGTQTLTVNPQLTVTAQSDAYSICQNGKIGLTATPSVTDANTTYNWQFLYTDDGYTITANSSTPTFDYSGLDKAGKVTASLVVLSDGGCMATTKMTTPITVYAAPKASFSVLNTLPICSNTLNLQNTSTGGGGNMSYEWVFSPTISEVQSAIASISKTLPTSTYNVQLKSVGNLSGCTAISDIQTINVGQPTIQLTADKMDFCTGQYIHFDGNVNETGYKFGQYTWYVNNQVPSDDNKSNKRDIYFGQEGAVNVGISTTSGCIANATITVNAYQQPSADFGYSIQSECQNNVIQLTNQTNGQSAGMDYSWNLNDLSTYAGQTPPAQSVPSSMTSYTVTLKATNSRLASCSSSVSRTIAIPSVNKLNISLSPGPLKGCIKSQYIAIADPSITLVNDAIIGYVWDWDDGNLIETTTSNQSPSHMFSTTGGHTLTVTAKTKNNCTLISESLDISVGDYCPLPTNGINPDLNIKLSNDGCDNRYDLTLTNLVTTATSVEWSFEDPSLVIVPDKNANEIKVHFPDQNHTATFYGSLKRTVDGTVVTLPFSLEIIDEQPAIKLLNTFSCINADLKFQDEGSAQENISHYKWSVNNGTVIDGYTNNILDYTFLENSNNTITLTTVDVNNCTSAPAMLSFATQGPTANFTFAPGIHADKKNNFITSCFTTFNALLSDNSTAYATSPLASWNWAYDGYWSNDDVTSSINHTFNNSATDVYKEFKVLLKVTDANGCFDTLTQVVAKSYYPQPSFTGNDQPSCADQDNSLYNYTFTNTSLAKNPTYTWDFGDNSTVNANGNTVTHKYPVLATGMTEQYYTPVLTVTDENGCTASTSKTDPLYLDFVKLVRPLSSFTISAPTSICIPRIVGITNNSLHSVSYNWDYWGDGSATSTQQDPGHYIYDKAVGSYYLTLTVTGPNGCKDTHQELIDLTGPLGTLVKNNLSTPTCIPFDPKLEVENSTAEYYNWIFGDNSLSGDFTYSNQPDFKYTSSGIYNPQVIMYRAGCAYLLSLTPNNPIVVYDIPVAAITPLDPDTYCAGTRIKLTAEESVKDYDPLGHPYNYTYKWDPINSNTDQNNGNILSVLPNTTTTYNLSVSNGTCTGYANPYTVNIAQKPSIISPDKLVICTPRDNSTSFDISLQNADLLTWGNYPDLTSSGTYHFVASPTANTSYTFTASQSNHICPSVTKTIPVVLASSPTINNITLRLGKVVPEVFVRAEDGPISAGQQVTLYPDITNANDATQLNYLWTPATGLNNYNAWRPIFSSDQNVTYHLRVSNEYGCFDSMSVHIKVTDIENAAKYAQNMPNAFTPNADGKNDYFYIMGYGISLVNNFTIFDRWGKIIFQKNNIAPNVPENGWDGMVGAQQQATGTYIYTANITTNEGKIVPIKGSFVLIR